jgi:macrolide-specific efflux system membrane fusion protein
MSFRHHLTAKTPLVLGAVFLGLMVPWGALLAQKKPRQQATSGADLLPVHTRPCQFDHDMTVAVRVRSKEQYEARPTYSVVLEKIHVKKGERVKKGQLLVSTNTKSLTQMLGIYNDYLAMYAGYLKVVTKDLKVTEGRRDRLKGLVAKGIIPQSELEAADKLVLSVGGNVQNVTRSKEGIQKNIDQLNQQIREANFYSGIDGIVTDLIADPDNMGGSVNVYPGTPVARVEKPGSYIADATLIDTQIHRIKSGMSATVIFGDGTSRPGSVVFVSPLSSTAGNVADNGAGSWGAPPNPTAKLPTYTVHIGFTRDGDILPNGLMAAATLVTDTVSGGRCLPYNALVFEGGKPHIKVFSEGSGWRKQPIEIGRRGRYEFEVKTSLDDSVIVQSKLW